jgi:pimeloyl-ACP methyl ester carboxylesterase
MTSDASLSPRLRHDRLDVNGARIHYVTAGSGEPILFIHGFPETWYQWRHLIPHFAERFTVIAPDFRGAGDSFPRPAAGYDKATMARDIHAVVERVTPGRKPIVVGHDLGAMVAYAYATRFPEEVRGLVVVDAPIPGTNAWRALTQNPAVWHVAFHQARDMAEMLVSGHERAYLEWFFRSKAYRQAGLPEDDLEVYIRAYSAPGALRAAFEAYRAIPVDALENEAIIAAGPIRTPTLLIAADTSNSASVIADMAVELGDEVQFARVLESGHWISEEQPALLIELLDNFINQLTAP